MKTKLFVMMALLLVVLMCFVACGTENTTTTAAEETTTEAPVTTLAPLASFDSLKIAGNDIKDYTIVYAESPHAARAAENPDLYPVYDFDKESAERLAELIFKVTGARLTVALDTATEVGAKEILIGETNRELTKALSLSKVKTDEYVIQVSDATLVICGGIYGTTWHALDYIEKEFTTSLENQIATKEFAADYSYKGNHHMIQIACIGDSITEGYGVQSANFYAYPAQLGRLLWKDAIVTNLGVSGKTMRNDLADAYTKTGNYTRALNSASRMDIFTVMLGTNDSNRDRNWNNNSTAQFNESCKQLFEALSAKNDDLKFVLANCPAYFGSDAFGSANVRNLQKKLVTEMNTLGYETTFFDMYSVTKTMRANYPDLLHPNAEGHLKMAIAFAEALNAVIHPPVEE